ncbi:unnamed protein product [Paramecium sonneborni]|uniref:Uncharacterized protein n=1 Tax=Paramecium sonneborni TaxID=65129 RepID=A0A8S1P235_9CILI|nr:unnamed protein product [Paramecium sonneborni]
MNDNIIQRLKEQHELEKQQMLKEFMKRIDLLLQSNVQKYPEVENWKELILKYEKQRQNELYELRQHLEVLQRSQINTKDIEFNAERRVYENKIYELQNKLQQDDVQDLYDTIEYQRNVILELEDQIGLLQNERQQLDQHIQQLNQTIEVLKDNLSRYQQQQNTRRKQKAEVIEAIDEMKREREREREKERERDTDRYRDLDSFSPQRPYRYSHKSSWERNNNKDWRFSNQQVPSPRPPVSSIHYQSQPILSYQQENKEIVSKLQEVNEIKYKYQTALNNILKLETQVIEKLQQDDIIVE